MKKAPSYAEIFRDLIWRMTSTKLIFAIGVIILILCNKDMEVETIIGLLTAQGVFSVGNVLSKQIYATSD